MGGTEREKIRLREGFEIFGLTKCDNLSIINVF